MEKLGVTPETASHPHIQAFNPTRIDASVSLNTKSASHTRFSKQKKKNGARQ